MRHQYETKGTCSRMVSFDVHDGILSNIKFDGGCHGNLQGVARLSEGRKVEEVLKVLAGIKCGDKKTSCPDQFAKALKKQIAAEKKKGSGSGNGKKAEKKISL